MKRFLLILLLAFCAASCGIPKGLKVSFDGLQEIRPSGFYEFDLEVRFRIANPGADFELRDAHGVLRFEGAQVLECNADDFTVHRGTDSTVPVRISCRLSESYNFYNLLNVLNTKDLDSFKVDLDGKICPKGSKNGRTVVYKGIPASKFVR